MNDELEGTLREPVVANPKYIISSLDEAGLKNTMENLSEYGYSEIRTRNFPNENLDSCLKTTLFRFCFTKHL
jgi:hypothetical protein